MITRAGRAVTLGIAGALVAAGCSGQAHSPQAVCANTTMSAATTGVVRPSSHRGGTLYLWGNGTPIDSLDPARTYWLATWDFLRMWQRGLTAFKPGPGAAGRSVVADLAESLGTASDDNRTWTYHLRPGVRFEDRQPITSLDVKYGIERLFATDVINGGPARYFLDLLDNGQHYPGPYRDRSRTGLRSISTPDPRTMVFHLSRPFADFDDLMALPPSTPVPAAKDTRTRYEDHPVATGPYKIATYRPNLSLVLVRNPEWEPQSDPLRKALPDRIVVDLSAQDSTVDAKLLSGPSLRIDGVGLLPGTAARVLKDTALRCDADLAFSNFTRYLSIAQSTPPLGDVHCRRAIHYATDRAAIQTAFGGPLEATMTSTMVPPNLATYDPRFDPYPSSPGGTGDTTQAHAELQMCGYPNGFSLKLATMDRGRMLAAAVAEQKALARVGITATIVPFRVNDYYAWIGVPANIHKFGIGVEVLGWGPDFPTEFGLWDLLVDARLIQQLGNTNYAELRDSEVQADLGRANAAPDAAARESVYRDLAKRVMADAVYVPLLSATTLTYRSPRLTNLYISAAYGSYDLMAVGVSP